MLYLFDVDGTIAERDTVNILPGVREWFKALDWRVDKVAFVTNQGGVGLRYWMEKDGFGDPSKYPTREQVIHRLSEIEQELVPPTQELNSEIYVCFAYQSKTTGKWGPTPYGAIADNFNIPQEWSMYWRKPAPGMLLQAMFMADVKPSDAVMIGDSDDDLQVAQAAGVKFVWAKDFFNV